MSTLSFSNATNWLSVLKENLFKGDYSMWLYSFIKIRTHRNRQGFLNFLVVTNQSQFRFPTARSYTIRVSFILHGVRKTILIHIYTVRRFWISKKWKILIVKNRSTNMWLWFIDNILPKDNIFYFFIFLHARRIILINIYYNI